MLKKTANMLSKITICLAVFTLAVFTIKLIFFPIEIHLGYGTHPKNLIDNLVKWNFWLDLAGFKKISFTETNNLEEMIKYKGMIYPNSPTAQFIFIVGRKKVIIDPDSENAELELKTAICENNLILPRCLE